MAVQGSGTQADPWTHVDLSAYDFCRMVTDGNTYYAKIGAHFNVTDSGDPSDEVDYFVGNVNPSTYGIYRSGWDLVGTCSTAGTVTIEVKEVWPEFEEEYSKTITLVILPSSSGPTLHVKVSNGGWVGGKPFVKVNGAWKEAKKVYVKVNGAWKESM